MHDRPITASLLREAATYLSASSEYEQWPYRSPFMCHAVAQVGGDSKAFEALLIECGGMEPGASLMQPWDHPEQAWEEYAAQRQPIRFMLLLFLAEMLESEAT